MHAHEPPHPKPTPVAAPDTGSPLTTYLPASLSPLIGREREIRAIHDLLGEPTVRLLTLTGAGGVGKTRLALEVARTSGNAFRDGAWFVPLADVRNPDLVASAMAHQLGVHDSGSRSLVTGIATALHDKEALLVLDNFEHVLDAAPLVAEILTLCPRLTCLATSRAVLRLTGEHAYPVPPLALPPAANATNAGRAGHSAAVRLFVLRAQASQPAFALTDENAADVERICRRLDGLPLAIELAAARARHLSAAELASHLIPGQTAAPLRVLTGGPRDAPDRQRALRQTIAWSYDLLSAEERDLLQRLGVFVDGFTLTAAEAVADPAASTLDVRERVASLVDQSLLWRRDGDDGNSRFGMLETIREFALEELARADDEWHFAHAAHAAYYLAFTDAAAPGSHGADQDIWLRRIDAELPNIRAALSWLDSTNATTELARLCWALHWLWKFLGLCGEGRSWYERVLEKGGDLDPVHRQAALIGATHYGWVLGDAGRAEETAREVVALARSSGRPFLPGLAELMLAKVTYWQGDMPAADRLSDEALALLRQETSWEGRIMHQIALNDIGINLAHAGRFERGISLLESALALVEPGNRRLAGVHWSDLGLAVQAAGDETRAEACYREGLHLLHATNSEWYLAIPLAGIAACYSGRDPDRAAVLLGAVAALRERVGQPNWAIEQERDQRVTARIRLLLGDEVVAREWANGRGMPLDEVVALALRDDDSPASTGTRTRGPGTLSERESDVLRLLVAGRSDREIAEALFISRRTASKHVGNILAKLGVATRQDAATRALEDGLV